VAQLAEQGTVHSMVVEEQQVADALADVVGRHGHVDSCFANAGLSKPRTRLIDTSLADFRAVTKVDLDGAFVTLREAARHMIAAGQAGSLVATSSMSVLTGPQLRLHREQGRTGRDREGARRRAGSLRRPGQRPAARLDREPAGRTDAHQRDVRTEGDAARVGQALGDRR
jgi:NAD(P)-dependent dehydrogenase (short-subunit alcohol dehydrogenase family)